MIDKLNKEKRSKYAKINNKKGKKFTLSEPFAKSENEINLSKINAKLKNFGNFVVILDLITQFQT